MAAEPGFDTARLAAFLRGALPQGDAITELTRIGGGQSNPTFFLTWGTQRMVLRKQPGGELLPSAHAVDREHRVMTALAGSGVPVPPTVLFCDDRSVVGTPFYLMQRLDGRVFPNYALPEVAAAERTPLLMAMADTLAALHGVDWRATGLAGYGREGGFFERQVARWTKQWAASKTAENADVERLIRWLPTHVPPGDETTLVHGDFRLGNLMFHPTEPRVIAVLDWELSTLGHPLADVAFSAMAWLMPPQVFDGIRGLDLAALQLPTQQNYLARYHQASGRTERVTVFHLAFSLFRMAVIFEGIAARARAGTAAAENAAQMGQLAGAFARRAVGLIEENPSF